MVFAGPVNVIRTILIILLVYFGLRVLFRVVVPWVMKLLFKKVASRMEDQMNARREESVRNSDDVYIRKRQNQGRKSPKDFDGGEYVDFEEVKD
jgi:hypothetical protein